MPAGSGARVVARCVAVTMAGRDGHTDVPGIPLVGKHGKGFSQSLWIRVAGVAEVNRVDERA
jgi:hypothetical protein